MPVTALALAGATAIVVSIIGLISGWRNTIQFSNGMFIAGAITIAIALLFSMGGQKKQTLEIQSASDAKDNLTIGERSRLWVEDLLQGYNAFLLMTLVGALLIGLSVIIGAP